MLTVGVVMRDPAFRDALVEGLESLAVDVAFAVGDASREAEKVERTSPDILVLDFGSPATHAVMAQLKQLADPPIVIGAHISGDPDIILQALRAGAREFVYPPLNVEGLKRTVQTLAAERTSRNVAREKARTIGFLSASGGCGATTLACHVAAGLRQLDAGQVLLADLDLAAGAAGFWFKCRNGYSLLDVIQGLPRMDDSLWNGMVNCIQPGLDMVPAPAEIPAGSLPGSRGISDVLRIGRRRYDWVIGDLGQHLSPLSASLVQEFSTLVLVTTAELSSLYQAHRIGKKLVQLGFTPTNIKLVVNRVQGDQAREIEGLEDTIGFPAEMVISEDRRGLAEAQSAGRLLGSQTATGHQMMRLAARLAGRKIDPLRPERFSVLRFWA